MIIRRTLAAIFLAVSATGAAHAFPEKNIDFVIPYGPGGGNDNIVRLIVPYLEKHLPGNATVVPRNIDGAGGQRGATAIYRAQPDGYTIGLFPMPGLALPEILGEDVNFNLRDMSWLARIEASYYALLVPASSDIYTLEDFKDGREITFLATGFGSTMLAASQMVAGVLDVDAEYITGYQSSSEALVGLMRGDGNAAMGVIEPSAGYVASGDLRAIAVSAHRDALPDIETFSEQGYPELDILSIDRWVGAPPNLDPEVRQILEEALAAAIADPEFVEAATRANIVPAPLTGVEVDALVEENYIFFERYRDQLGNPANN